MLSEDDINVFEESKCKRRIGRSRKDHIRGAVLRLDWMKTKWEGPHRVKYIRGVTGYLKGC